MCCMMHLKSVRCYEFWVLQTEIIHYLCIRMQWSHIPELIKQSIKKCTRLWYDYKPPKWNRKCWFQKYSAQNNSKKFSAQKISSLPRFEKKILLPKSWETKPKIEEIAYNSHSPCKYNTCNDDTTDHQEIRTYWDSLTTYQLFRYIIYKPYKNMIILYRSSQGTHVAVNQVL